jgi:uncharacterized membrane protein YhaH (DUF805 family)
MNWYLGVLKKYAVFDGRARRKEYWFFFLFTIIVSVILAIIDNLTGTYNSKVGIGLLGGLYALGTLLPGIGVTIRRLHDTGRTGWWILIAFVPIVGGIILLIFMVLDGNPGENKYGPDPKAAPA